MQFRGDSGRPFIEIVHVELKVQIRYFVKLWSSYAVKRNAKRELLLTENPLQDRECRVAIQNAKLLLKTKIKAAKICSCLSFEMKIAISKIYLKIKFSIIAN